MPEPQSKNQSLIDCQDYFTETDRVHQTIYKLQSHLDFSVETMHRASGLYACAAKAGITTGKSPVAIGAACVYAATQTDENSLTLTDCADPLPITRTSISNRYHEIMTAWNDPEN